MKMKKYLMTGIAALALCAGFTSCSHDLEQMSQEEITNLEAQKVVETYKKAFKNYVGGEIASTQTWGFGVASTSTRSISDYAGAKGDMKPKVNGVTYTFPSAPENFPTAPTVKNDDNYYGGGYKYYNGEVIWMDENTSSHVEVQGYGDLYIVKSGEAENVTIESTDMWYVGNVPYGSGQKFRVFVCPGVTLKIPTNDAGNLQANVEYYVAPGASLICDSYIKLNGTNLFVAPGGYVSGASFETNGTGIFYNMGTAAFEGQVTVENNTSIFVNDGTLTAANLLTKGSGRFQNNAEVTITEKTIVNSNDNIWVNNGFYHTGYFEFTATSSSVINNCKLFVDHDFFMNCADGSSIFQMEGGATSGASVVTTNFYGGGVYTGGFNGGPYRIEMGSKSLFKVTETAYLNATASGTTSNGYGFFGVGSDYAVFQAKRIERGDNIGHGLVAYGGKLCVYAEEYHFAQGKNGSYDYIYFFDGDDNQVNIYAPGADFMPGTPDITIPKTNCNPGFNITSDPDTWFVRVMAEDLSASDDSDFDFNDVVIDVKYTKGESTADITLQAAGGTLPLRINGNDNLEVHKLFGFATNIMINTGWKGSNGATADPYEFTLPFSATTEAGFLTGVNNIKLEVEKTVNGEKKWLEMTAHEGEPASKFAVPSKIQWCAERESIKGKYELFAQWATSGDAYTFRWW